MIKSMFYKKRLVSFAAVLLCAVLLLCGCGEPDFHSTYIPNDTASVTDGADGGQTVWDSLQESDGTDAGSGISNKAPTEIVKAPAFDLSSVGEYSGQAYVPVNNNVPFFSEGEYTTAAFELYSDLDSLGRCGTVYANVCIETMPTDERGSISSVKPSGWQSVQYDIVDGKYLYNRCHLIGWQLTAENANEQNLITGTRYLNIEGMLLFENMVADYVKEEQNHVLYRVTPIFSGTELVARGVLMEAYSVEDGGEGISFCVYCYNVQPGVVIDHTDGSSYLASDSGTEESTDAATEAGSEQMEYILNTNTKKFHYPHCRSVDSISEKNKKTYTGTRDELIDDGYEPCGNCDP